ncbi:hypothetical protein [Thiohalomonas denitrificans]|uniref:Uncharacterized protein n=1 Tax=Thiohalomonas denitrificans TaxID=415747 RepID=A0A1G5PQY5_9GAMM|nr:hypothetical protein [Thiohalomonas denitrificans]SCZ51863.1 hypothetical protein SAMN03097708_00607 [Thiohalomonas denitrificans]
MDLEVGGLLGFILLVLVIWAIVQTVQSLVYCCMLGDTFRAPQKRQDKAQCAGNGYSLIKRCNAVMAFLGGSLRASR